MLDRQCVAARRYPHPEFHLAPRGTAPAALRFSPASTSCGEGSEAGAFSLVPVPPFGYDRDR
jgi:hypothetical protein